MVARLVVLVSGEGTNLQALIDACRDPGYGAQVVAVGADRDQINGLARAEQAGLPVFTVRLADYSVPQSLGPGTGPGLRGLRARPGRAGRVHEAGQARRSWPPSAAGA